MIEITITTKDGPKKVKAHKSACKDLVIHKPLEGNNTWVITHIPSGYAILKSINTLKNARHACKIFAQIPAWDDLTPANAREFFNTHRVILLAGKDAAYENQLSVGH